jgi:hypothetical protein
MEGYSKSEKYTEFKEDEDEDDWEPQKTKIKYTLLKEEDFIDEEE